jgi:hypothetical protein
MTDPDLEILRRPVKRDANITHDWSLPPSHPIPPARRKDAA